MACDTADGSVNHFQDCLNFSFLESTPNSQKVLYACQKSILSLYDTRSESFIHNPGASLERFADKTAHRRLLSLEAILASVNHHRRLTHNHRIISRRTGNLFSVTGVFCAYLSASDSTIAVVHIPRIPHVQTDSQSHQASHRP